MCCQVGWHKWLWLWWNCYFLHMSDVKCQYCKLLTSLLLLMAFIVKPIECLCKSAPKTYCYHIVPVHKKAQVIQFFCLILWVFAQCFIAVWFLHFWSMTVLVKDGVYVWKRCEKSIFTAHNFFLIWNESFFLFMVVFKMYHVCENSPIKTLSNWTQKLYSIILTLIWYLVPWQWGGF